MSQFISEKIEIKIWQNIVQPILVWNWVFAMKLNRIESIAFQLRDCHNNNLESDPVSHSNIFNAV